MPDLSLILPVLDEESIIEKVCQDIKNILDDATIDYEIILVENGSTDHTWEVLNKLARNDKRIIATQTKKGYGSAVLKGLSIATGKFVGYMPSDGQIDAAILPRLLNEAQSDRYQLVKVKRLNRENWLRYIRSKIFNLLAHLLFPIDIVDINGSPRIFKSIYLKILNLSYQDSFIDTEFAMKAHILRWSIKELPMRNLDRVGGKSTVRVSTVFEFLRNLLTFRFGNQLNLWRIKHHIA